MSGPPQLGEARAEAAFERNWRTPAETLAYGPPQDGVTPA